MIVDKQTIEQIFDGAAATYDRTGPRLFRQFGERLVEHMGLVPGMQVLDVATGTGAVLIPAAVRVAPDGHVTGIDLSQGIVDEARRAADAAGLKNVSFQQMDAEHMDFPAGSFDAVTCAFALFLFPDLTAALREMARVCKPGGRIGVTLFSRQSPPFDPGWPILYQQFRAYNAVVRMPNPVAYLPEELQSVLKGNGLSSVEIIEEKNEVVYPNEEDWWAFQLTVGSRAAILGMDEETRARFREEYLGKLRPLFKADGLHLTVSLLYAIAPNKRMEFAF